MAADQKSELLPLHSYVLYLSLSLTLLTILNSIFRPGERFREACLLGIKIAHFKSELLTALEEMKKITDASLLELVERYRKAFERYQEQLIGLFLPELAGLEYRVESGTQKPETQ